MRTKESMIHFEKPHYTKNEILDDYWGIAHRSINRFGEKDFIVTKDGSLSFRKANQIANVICSTVKETVNAAGVGIGIFLMDPRDIVPSMIGVLKAQDYFTVLDVTFPEATIKFMVEKAELKIVLTTDPFVEKLQKIFGKKIHVLNINSLNFNQEIEDPIVNYSPDDIVQIIFTSGSTGQPKGAVENYRYLSRVLSIKLSDSTFHPYDHLLQMSSFSFTVAHIGVFFALLHGISLFYFNLKEDGFVNLPVWIKKTGITIYQSNVTSFRTFISTLDSNEKFPKIRFVHLGGEKTLNSDIRSIKKHFPRVDRIYLGYGATELPMLSFTYFPIDYNFGEKSLPNGRPAQDLQIHIWDEVGKPLPAGEEGEIIIYSDALVNGYINNQEMTLKHFIPDPLNPGWKYFKTGDLGKMHPNGQLEHLGRLDNMVKIKGVRIELDSIANQVLQYPGIIHVTSKAIEDIKGNKKIATYFISEKGTEIPISDLRKYLAERLPLYLLPHYLIGMKEFPLTSNNKVALGQLPSPKLVRPELSNEYILPIDAVEKKLVEIWEDQLGITGIGVTDDFFDVGGDSLLGVLIFASIDKVFGRSLPVSTLLKTPTIRQLAKILSKPEVNEDFLPIIPFNTSGGNPPVFFIPGKGGYPTRIRHLLKKLGPQTPVYALQDLLENRIENVSRTVEAIASIYLKEIKKLFPNGPYLLIGESLGGKIAYEIAQQLRQNGEPEPVLVLLDTYNFEDSEIDVLTSRKSIPYYKMIIQKHLSILARADWQGKKEYLRFYLETFVSGLRSFVKRKRNGKNIKNSVGLPENIQKQEIENRRSARAYEVKSYPGQVILVKALRGPNAKNPTNGWDKVEIGEMIIHTVDCYHGSILFEPAVSELAVIVQSYIDKNNKGIG